MSVLHLRKPLDAPPVVTPHASITVRHFQVPNDVHAWLDLRHSAAAGLVPAPRPWRHEDFHREMLDKPWWKAEHTWLAFADSRSKLLMSYDASRVVLDPGRGGGPPGSPKRSLAVQESIIGAVTLALREGPSKSTAVVHWLLVDPAWRRRGIARLLMTHLERAAWEAGWREVELETHTAWRAAVRFYQSIGYEAVRDPAAR